MGDRELAEDTGLARSAYISSESALRTELLLEEADDTEDTLLTDRDLDHKHTHKKKNQKSHTQGVSYLSKLNNRGQVVCTVFSAILHLDLWDPDRE